MQQSSKWESVFPFPACGAEIVTPFPPISPYFHPVMLNSFPSKLYYCSYLKKKKSPPNDYLGIQCDIRVSPTMKKCYGGSGWLTSDLQIRSFHIYVQLLI